MKKNIKTLALLLAAALTAVLLSGCVARDMRVSFGDDGKISCIVSDLIAQSYFEAAGTDAQTYYKDEIEAGRELISKKVGNETYYGLRPERNEFDTIEEFCSATESGVIDAFSVTAQNDGGYISATVTVDMTAKGKVEETVEGYGAAAALANKAVKVLNVHFPQKVNSYAGSYAVTISEDQKDLEAVLYYFDEAYSFRVTGYLSEKYVVNASLKMGRPEEDRTPGGLMENARLESYPRGSADLAGAEWRWYDMSTPAKTEIGADEPYFIGTVRCIWIVVKIRHVSPLRGSFGGESCNRVIIIQCTHTDHAAPTTRVDHLVFMKIGWWTLGRKGDVVWNRDQVLDLSHIACTHASHKTCSQRILTGLARHQFLGFIG